MKNFERKIIDELIQASELKDIFLSSTLENEVLEINSAGYFLTIKDPTLPEHRIKLDSPDIRGKLGGIEVGYLAFVKNSELVLECYTYEQEISPQHRELGFVRNTTLTNT